MSTADVAMPTVAGTPALPGTGVTPDNSREELIARGVAAIARLNAADRLRWTVETRTTSSQRFVINAHPLADSRSDSGVLEQGALARSGATYEGRVTDRCDFRQTDASAAGPRSYTVKSELRRAGQDVFITGTSTQPDLSGPVPAGWFRVNSELSLALWPGLDEHAGLYRFIRPEVDPAVALLGWLPDEVESILTKTTVTATVQPATLNGGTPVDVITLALNRHALPVLAHLSLSDDTGQRVFNRLPPTPVVVTFTVDEAGDLRAWSAQMGFEVEDMPADLVPGQPEHSTVSIGYHITVSGTVDLDAPAVTVDRPRAESATFPRFANPGYQGNPPFATLADLDRRLGDVARSGDARAFWSDVQSIGQMPLIFGGHVVFLYRGTGNSVQWNGDWTGQVRSTTLRVEGTDVWASVAVLPADARLEYQIVVDGKPILDPLNPLAETGGLGTKSAFAMPGYVWPAAVRPRTAGPRGSLTGDLTLTSRLLGYDVHYRVYTPAGYDRLPALPVLYVTDGQDYIQYGSLPNILDNLVADGSIRPVIAVFVDPRDTGTGRNLREAQFLNNPTYGRFIAEELVPAIDGSYRTDPSPDARAILGTSYGGYHAAYFALRHNDLFHLIGIQSPAFQYDLSILDAYDRGETLPLKIFMQVGTMNDLAPVTRMMRGILEAKGYALRYMERPEGHSYGNWRGALDEMLEYFFAAQSAQ